jgi:hypothetical protein
MEIKIGSCAAENGTKSHGLLEVSRGSAGFPIAIPVNIVNGIEDGPMLVADAAMHGTEVIGTIALSRFFKTVDPKRLKGAFIGVPVLNTWAFEALHRLPIGLDSFDMETLFPGKQDGSISDRIAYAFMNEIARRADCLIDFHGQDHFWQPTSAIITPQPAPQGNVKPAVYQKCVEVSKAFGVRQIWRINKPGSVTETIMNEKGIPAISPEFGGVADFRRTEKDIDLAIEGIKNIMRWLGMLDEAPVSHNYRTCVCDLHPVFNRFGGIWSSSVEVGDEVEEGDIVGTVSGPFTAEVIEEIRAPFSGVITNLWCSPVIKPAVLALGMGKVVEYL